MLAVPHCLMAALPSSPSSIAATHSLTLLTRLEAKCSISARRCSRSSLQVGKPSRGLSSMPCNVDGAMHTWIRPLTQGLTHRKQAIVRFFVIAQTCHNRRGTATAVDINTVAAACSSLDNRMQVLHRSCQTLQAGFESARQLGIAGV